MPADPDWMPLNRAAELMSAARDVQSVRIELVDEMVSGRLVARARRWTEEGAPSTFQPRPLPVELDDGFTQIPRDFWLRGHAFEGPHHVPVSASTTEADWQLLRFRMSYLVDGGQPGWSDRWGLGVIDFGRKTWTWTRVAIGVTVEASTMHELLEAYSIATHRPTQVPSPAGWPLRGGWGVADEPLIERGMGMVTSGAARSAHDAARELAPEAQGHGSIESKIDRLGRRIRDRLKQLGDGEPNSSGLP